MREWHGDMSKKTISLRDAKDDGALGRRERMLSYLKKFASSSSLLRDIRSWGTSMIGRKLFDLSKRKSS